MTGPPLVCCVIWSLPTSPLPNSKQINHPFSNHTYTKSTTNHIHCHDVPFVTLTHTTHIISLTAPINAPCITPGFVDRLRRSDGTAGQMDGEAGWQTTSGNTGFPPLARVKGVGRQHRHQYLYNVLYPSIVYCFCFMFPQNINLTVKL